MTENMSDIDYGEGRSRMKRSNKVKHRQPLDKKGRMLKKAKERMKKNVGLGVSLYMNDGYCDCN